jgi:hypothetical protein
MELASDEPSSESPESPESPVSPGSPESPESPESPGSPESPESPESPDALLDDESFPESMHPPAKAMNAMTIIRHKHLLIIMA